MKKCKNGKKAKRSFCPDQISARFDRALKCDVQAAQYVYGGLDSVGQYALNRQAAELLKKYCSPTQDAERLEQETFAKFREVNSHMAATNAKLRKKLKRFEAPRILASMPLEQKTFLRARALMHSVLGVFHEDLTEEEWFRECKNSSGSSIGVPYMDTSVEAKFTFPMSATKNAAKLFERYRSFDSELNAAILDLNAEDPVGGIYNIVESSRATTVDKTTTKRRFICIEPTCNMFLQQGVMRMMYKRMKKWGLDVETLPDRHKLLAKISSISGENATIDWSSASDCVSIELLRGLLPRKWFDTVMLIRCDNTSIKGEVVPLHMVSSMGNAGTFPLESLVFWTYAMAVSFEDDTLSLYPELDTLDRCSVFGDDCIIPTKDAQNFMRVLSDVGFIVNKEKSFYGTERFRESCGGDYFHGYDVRPYYLKAPHNTKVSSLEPWLYIIGNSLLKKYKSYFGERDYIYDKEVLRTLFGLFSEYKIAVKLVPEYFPDDSGLRISHDIQRLQRHYPELKLSRIAQSKHGTMIFNYCRFVYKDKASIHEGLRYAVWLKNPTRNLNGTITAVDSCPQPVFKTRRRNGGYVVAKGISCHWQVPAVRPES